MVVADVRGGRQLTPVRGRRAGAAAAVLAPGGLQEADGPARALQRVLRPEEGVLQVLLHPRRAVAAQHPGDAAMYPSSAISKMRSETHLLTHTLITLNSFSFLFEENFSFSCERAASIIMAFMRCARRQKKNEKERKEKKEKKRKKDRKAKGRSSVQQLPMLKSPRAMFTPNVARSRSEIEILEVEGTKIFELCPKSRRANHRG